MLCIRDVRNLVNTPNENIGTQCRPGEGLRPSPPLLSAALLRGSEHGLDWGAGKLPTEISEFNFTPLGDGTRRAITLPELEG